MAGILVTSSSNVQAYGEPFKSCLRRRSFPWKSWWPTVGTRERSAPANPLQGCRAACQSTPAARKGLEMTAWTTVKVYRPLSLLRFYKEKIIVHNAA
jgi:hypothetical protein